MPAADADKIERGHILVIGGCREMPGAVMLAAEAALRAGAGKLVVATVDAVAALVAAAVPEARVIGLAESDRGGVVPSSAERLAHLHGIDAVLIGPGMQDEEATVAFVRSLAPLLPDARLVLDAYAMSAVISNGDALRGREILLTPHAGEMAHLTGEDRETICDDPRTAARRAARDWNVVVAVKGAHTVLATPDGRTWQHDGGTIGLATSGSGDVLAGIIGGLVARGAPVEQAAAWGVVLHAMAAQRLAQRQGPLGYLARELAGEIPFLMQTLVLA